MVEDYTAALAASAGRASSADADKDSPPRGLCRILLESEQRTTTAEHGQERRRGEGRGGAAPRGGHRHSDRARPLVTLAPDGHDPARSATSGPPLVAYFSMEFGLHEEFHSYSGGLGVLAGDFMKSAGDLRRPVVGVGLRWRQGYTVQRIGPDGYPYDEWEEHAADFLGTRALACGSAWGGARWSARSGGSGATPSPRSICSSPPTRATGGSRAGSTTPAPTAASPRRCSWASAACARSRRSTCPSRSTTSTRGTRCSRAWS